MILLKFSKVQLQLTKWPVRAKGGLIIKTMIMLNLALTSNTVNSSLVVLQHKSNSNRGKKVHFRSNCARKMTALCRRSWTVNWRRSNTAGLNMKLLSVTYRFWPSKKYRMSSTVLKAFAKKRWKRISASLIAKTISSWTKCQIWELDGKLWLRLALTR